MHCAGPRQTGGRGCELAALRSLAEETGTMHCAPPWVCYGRDALRPDAGDTSSRSLAGMTLSGDSEFFGDPASSSQPALVGLVGDGTAIGEDEFPAMGLLKCIKRFSLYRFDGTTR